MQPLHHQTRYIDVELRALEQTEILRNQSLAHFAIDPKTLDCILDANNIEFLGQYGGIEGIASALESNLEMGLGLITTIYTCETVDLALNKTSLAGLWISGKILKEAKTELTHELLDALRKGVGHLTRSGPFEDALLCWAKPFLLK
ncbi:hypothetical protein LOK49_LG06G00355 [Camellia lanceoleosa]|uniref:Uncharacterized protein n=1 Tax=Camellia lanceoleosa TaxID=1840588 RepID=A0ACC0HET6_9ERIC|nr:hypothetical protein LOK49_LG06G00355 [Camellia lanceoleosa]